SDCALQKNRNRVFPKVLVMAAQIVAEDASPSSFGKVSDHQPNEHADEETDRQIEGDGVTVVERVKITLQKGSSKEPYDWLVTPREHAKDSQQRDEPKGGLEVPPAKGAGY